MSNFNFQKIELPPSGKRHSGEIWLTKQAATNKLPTMFCLSPDIMRDAGFAPGTRFDVLRDGTTFCFEKCDVGLLTVGKSNRFVSTPLSCLVRGATDGATQFDAVVEDGRIIFWPRKSGGETVS